MSKTGERMGDAVMIEDVYHINQTSETRDIIKFHLCGTTYPDEKYQINRALSKIYCIEYVEQGTGTVQLDDEIFFPHAGDSYFLHAGKNQNYYSSRNDPWKKHFVTISGRLVEHLIEGYEIANVSYFEGLDTGDEIKRIIEVAQREGGDHTLEFIAVINAIFLKMHNHAKRNEEFVDLGSRMTDFLNTRITSKFRIEELCEHISKSESQTIRIFKKAFGITPYAYVLGKKIGFAKKLLEDTNLPVEKIAKRLCFADEYYFSNMFKKRVGSSPSQYRKWCMESYKK